MTRFFLVRNAESQANQIQLLSDNSSLSQNGIKQANALGKRLVEYEIKKFYCSCNVQGIETANILASYHNLEPIRCSELNEISLGEWEGKTKQEVQQKHPNEFGLLVTNPLFVKTMIPGGESVLEVQFRSLQKINELIIDHKNDTICIVGHSYLNLIIICSLLGIELSNMTKISQLNCSLNMFEYDGAKVKFLLINDISHIEKDNLDMAKSVVSGGSWPKK